jgi:hypothetical protein
MDFEAYVCDPPKLHSWDGGKTWETRLGPDEFGVFYVTCVGMPDAAAIQTGCGNSSLTFLLSGVRRLVSIDIEHDVPDRIGHYCAEHGIDNTARVVIVEPSEWALAKLALAGNRFDNIELYSVGELAKWLVFRKTADMPLFQRVGPPAVYFT